MFNVEFITRQRQVFNLEPVSPIKSRFYLLKEIIFKNIMTSFRVSCIGIKTVFLFLDKAITSPNRILSNFKINCIKIREVSKE